MGVRYYYKSFHLEFTVFVLVGERLAIYVFYLNQYSPPPKRLKRSDLLEIQALGDAERWFHYIIYRP